MGHMYSFMASVVPSFIDGKSEFLLVYNPGYQNGRFIKHCSKPNTRLVVSATQVHARVLGLSAKAHSYNYLSAVVHGYADEPIDKHDLETKRILSEKIVNHIGKPACSARSDVYNLSAYHAFLLL